MPQHPNESTAAAVIVISSHVVRGSVGNRAAVFALETLGHPVWAVPTVVLPWHPGHGRATRIVPPAPEFSALMDDLAESPFLDEVAAVLTGYLGDAAQAPAIARLIDAVKARNPDALIVCDPVIGDAGGLYVPEATATAIRDHLLPRAGLATPNRFELEWLAGARSAGNGELMRMAAALGVPRMLVTSAHAMMDKAQANLLVSARRAVLAEHRHVDGAPNGPGDLTAALMTGRLLSGQDEESALQAVTSSVFEVLARSVKAGADELRLEAEAHSLIRPMAMVTMRQLARPAPKRAKP